MVLGDTVNTASRLQSIAESGTVLVHDVTRRTTEASIEYEEAGTHAVKGREQPVRAFTALRVVAGVGGARRSAGLLAEAEATLSDSIVRLRRAGSPFPLARGLLDLATLLTDADRADEAAPFLQEAASIFSPLRATPWIERTEALMSSVAAPS
jgi:hypothetical protein